MKVFLNPGHHVGVDSGAVNKKYNISESEIVRDIGELVEHYLNEAYIDAINIQSDNLNGENPKYPNVCKLANLSEADIFVSLHCNSVNNEKVSGTETLIYSFGGESEVLAECIQKEIVSTFNIVDRGIKERPNLIVLKNTLMPAVLVEIAFISNDEDAKLLMHQKDEIARSIARGITDYFGR